MNSLSEKSLTPIVLFVYNRKELTEHTINALKNNKLAGDSELYIYSDGAKNQGDKLDVEKVRTYLKTISGFKTVKIFESPINKGLANSIIQGVSDILKNHNSVIVLEDDLLTTSNFLQFMNFSLNQYAQQKNIFSVSGYSFNLGVAPHEKYDGYFLNRGWSWGWATWKDRWEKVDWEVQSYEKFKKDKIARKAFSKGGSDLNKMLDAQMNLKLDSWAIRWFYHQFLINGLTLYPIFSKVNNEGFGVKATHTKGSNKRYIPVLDKTSKDLFTLPKTLENSGFYQEKFAKKMGLKSRLISKIQTLFNI